MQSVQVLFTKSNMRREMLMTFWAGEDFILRNFSNNILTSSLSLSSPLIDKLSQLDFLNDLPLHLLIYHPYRHAIPKENSFRWWWWWSGQLKSYFRIHDAKNTTLDHFMHASLCQRNSNDGWWLDQKKDSGFQSSDRENLPPQQLVESSLTTVIRIWRSWYGRRRILTTTFLFSSPAPQTS